MLIHHFDVKNLPDLLLRNADEPQIGSLDVDLALDPDKLREGRYAVVQVTAEGLERKEVLDRELAPLELRQDGVPREELGEHTSRLALCPALAFANPTLKRLGGIPTWLAPVFRVAPGIVRAIARREMSRAMQHLERPLIDATCAAIERWSMAAAANQLYNLRNDPVPSGSHRRCIVVACTEDPFLKMEDCDSALSQIDFNLANRHWCIMDTHYPHLPDRRYPERTARNLDEIVRLLNLMLLDVREGAIASNDSRSAVDPEAPTVMDPSGETTMASSPDGARQTTEIASAGAPAHDEEERHQAAIDVTLSRSFTNRILKGGRHGPRGLTRLDCEQESNVRSCS